MPSSKPLSACVILCEKILNEEGILSAIRFADLFYIHPRPDITPEQQVVGMQLLVTCKFPSHDDTKHSIALKLVRPDGSETDVDLGRPLEFSLADIPLKSLGATRGINVIVPAWGVKATHMGAHRLILFVDGEEAASAAFTLALLPAQEA
jgi:hypothetical protein